MVCSKTPIITLYVIHLEVVMSENLELSFTQRIQALTERLNGQKTGRADQLRRQLGKQFQAVRSRYKQSSLNEGDGPVDQWLCDNYYLVEKEAKSLAKQLRGVLLPLDKATGLPEIYLLVRAAVFEESVELTTEGCGELIDLFEHRRSLTNFELDFFQMALRAAALEGVYQAVKTKNEALIARCITTFSGVDNIDFDLLTERNSRLEKILRQDPIYPKMNERTRQLYRYKISRIALKTGQNELSLAQTYLQQGGEHVGAVIYQEYDKLFTSTWGRTLHIPLLAILPAVAAVGCSLAMGNLLWSLLLYFPLWEILRPITERICMVSAKSEYTPRLDFQGDVPASVPTLAVIATMVPDRTELKEFRARLEKLCLTSSGEGISFCVLADLKQAASPILAEDEAKINRCVEVIEELNREYGGKFLFLVRRRAFSKTGGVYSGWERKRGAITELVRMIKGEKHSFQTFVGDLHTLQKTKYIIALDSDTQMLLESASGLVSIAEHPLNQPVIDRETETVTEGYGIFAPNVAATLQSSLATPFARVMCGLGGVSSYEIPVSDLYQDLYREGIFSGKGLINVEVFYDLLNDRFPSETVLSHDILEGSFLRTRFVSDISFVDGFPPEATPFFKRLHRWIRGDFQNIPYLFAQIQTGEGDEKNPLNRLTRFKLFDNLRRALSPCFSLLCLLAAFFAPTVPARWLGAVGLISTVAPYLFGLITMLLGRNGFAFSRKYYARIMPKGVEMVCQALYQFILLPKFALNAADAAVRAVYRRFHSHKKMLEWTTAAQAEKHRSSLKQVAASYWFCEAVGLFLIFSSRSYLRLAGILFLLTIPLVLYSSRRYKGHKKEIKDQQREELENSAAAMWNFYRDYAGRQDHFLPPDNVQEAPVFRIAHRTSPTNIGFLLLSIVSARDFGLIDTAEMGRRLTQTIDTVERLEKWNGNLYNWYDTKSLELLQPAFVSTVDSGNFVCSLVAVRESLLDYSLDGNFSSLIERIDRLIAQTDLSKFYNPNKKLLSIGYDVATEKLSGSHYDMLMSEARMTSYFAIATHQVPKRHWEFLSRTLASANSFTGPVSWTGTMFEYFMPELLLHCVEGSLGFEALNFCMACQRSRTKGKGVPFGISESAYYAFDNCLNYQYKAHGVQKLALKRGMDDELVISPYSSYLTLPYDFERSFRNLRWLTDVGAVGKYGHYEAVDFTKSRIRNKDYVLIKSYMAHHVGMSIVAVNNALNDKVMQKRFLRNKIMNRASELLEEKIIEGSILFEGIYKKDQLPKSSRETNETVELDQAYPQLPRVKLLSNGELTSIQTDSGSGYLSYQGLDVTRRPVDLLRRPNGVFAGIRIEDTVVPFTFAPDYYEGVKQRRIMLENNAISYLSIKKDVEVGQRVLLHPTIPCEQRQYAVKNLRNQKRSFEFLLYFEPVLSRFEDDSAHPAFSKLFVNIEYDEVTNTVTAKRKRRKDEKQIFLAAGFLENRPFQYEACRETVLERPRGIESLFGGFSRIFRPGNGTPDPCVAVKFTGQLAPREQKDFTFLICVGNSEEEAVQGIVAARRQGALRTEDAAKPPLAPDSIEGRLAFSLLPQLLFHRNDTSLSREAVERNQRSVQVLWSKGISGDRPIVLVEIKSAGDERAACYLSCQQQLNLANILFDLVFLYEEGREELIQAAREVDTALWIGQRIFLLDRRELDEEFLTALTAYACHVAPKSMAPRSEVEYPYTPLPLRRVSPRREQSGFSGESYFVDNVPSVPWSHVLANPQFGTLLSDRALGFTWAVNARECKLTPWYNDTMSDNRGELLLMKIGEKVYDLIDGAACEFHPDYARYRSKAEKLEITVTVHIAPKGMRKMIDLEITNNGGPVDLHIAYYTEPALYVDRSRAKQIRFSSSDNLLLLHNPANFSVRSFAGLWSDHPAVPVVNRPDFLCGRWEREKLASHPDPCAALIVEKKLPPKRSEKIRFILSFAETKSGLLDQVQLPELPADWRRNSIRIHTPDERLNHLFNTWLPWQNIAARMFARTGFFQCGGAYGFRDQLQDSCAAVLFAPKLAKVQILRACASQFPEGDVLHWWHMLPAFGGGKKGVRTRYSDDLLWLPYTVCEYIDKTGDREILEINVAFCTGELLAPHEHEKYLTVGKREAATVFEHCIRAIDKAHNLGEHGLPLMGCGDWNDGYNLVGAAGRGESVWLAQFLSIVLERFAPLCEEKRAADYLEKRERLLQAVHNHCWDGNWYIRAFFDNGDRMGASGNPECSIDSLPQSFSVLADMPDKARNRRALDSAYNRLFDRENKIIKLFENPFDHSDQEPGYVKSYPMGVRENGGQYTHGAVWLAMAMLKAGDAERGYELLKALSPAEKYTDAEIARRYKLEPYYMAADVYTNPSAFGRGGWSIYTGAAGWYTRTILEYLLGIRIRDGRVTVTPCLPKKWNKEFTVDLDYQDTKITLLYRPGNSSEGQGSIPLDGQTHEVVVGFE